MNKCKLHKNIKTGPSRLHTIIGSFVLAMSDLRIREEVKDDRYSVYAD